MRERNEYKNEKGQGNLELIYSFDDDRTIVGYVPDGMVEEYEGLRLWECALWALVPTFVFFLLISIVPLFVKKKNKKNKENKIYGGDC